MRRTFDLKTVITRLGSFGGPLAAGRCTGLLVTQAASVFVACPRIGDVLLWSGEGRWEFDFHMPELGEFRVACPDDTVASSLWLREWPDPQAKAGWVHGESFAQLDLKPRNAVSPEVQAMFDAMNHNAMVREMALREELAKLSGRSNR